MASQSQAGAPAVEGATADQCSTAPSRAATTAFKPVPYRPEPCRHFLSPKQTCTYGDACKFAHDKPFQEGDARGPRGSYFFANHSYMQRDEKTRLLRLTLDQNGFTPTTKIGDAAIVWLRAFPSLENMPDLGMKDGAVLNHFPRETELSHKVRLHGLAERQRAWKKTFSTAASAGDTDAGVNAVAAPSTCRLLCDYLPISFVIPDQVCDLRSYATTIPESRWIVKALASGEAKGTFITARLDDESLSLQPKVITKKSVPWRDPKEKRQRTVAGTRGVACLYVENPLLVNGYKVDLRLFVVITGIDNRGMRAYLHREGLVRFAAKPFSSADDSVSDLHVHITSNSINEKLDTSVRDTNWSLEQLQAWMTEHRDATAFQSVWREIQNLAAATLASAHTVMHAAWRSRPSNHTKCFPFALLGFDVLIDSELRPWLLEVNSMPDISASGHAFHFEPFKIPANWEVKASVLADMFSAAVGDHGIELPCNEMVPAEHAAGETATATNGPKQIGGLNMDLIDVATAVTALARLLPVDNASGVPCDNQVAAATSAGAGGMIGH